MANESKEALKLMQDNGCDVLDIKFIDLPGVWQHVSVPISEVNDGLFANGTGFDGSSIRGFQSIDESDMLLVPDKSTVKIDPFVDGQVTVIADIKDPVTGEFYTKDPRNVAKKAQEYLKSTGVGDSSFWGPEVEFFIFDSASFDYGPNHVFHHVDSDEGIWNSGESHMLDGITLNKSHRPKHKGGYFPVSPVDTQQDIRNEMIRIMQDSFDIKVEKQHHEVATAGQGEIDIVYNTLLETADNVMAYKYVVKNVAKRHGKVATFMPKPIFEDNGIPIANSDGLETRPRTTFVQNTTSLVTWKAGDDNARILYQFVDQAGLVFGDAKPVADFDAIQTSPRVKRSKDGEVFIQRKDLRFDPVDGDMFMQKVDSNGDALWAGGVQVDLTEGVNFSGRFSANNSGGFNIFWEKFH